MKREKSKQKIISLLVRPEVVLSDIWANNFQASLASRQSNNCPDILEPNCLSSSLMQVGQVTFISVR